MTSLSHLPTLKATIDAHGLSTRKSLGQHFLLDANIIRRIVGHAGDLTGHTAIEIGPGPGGLTRALLESDAARVVVVEKDERCLPIMGELARASDKLTIIVADALTYDPLTTPAPRRIVANLPYNVGTELLLAWLSDIARDPKSYASLTLMFQKEVAERIAAEPGGKEYGRLSVLAQWLCEVRYDMELPPGAFSPPPKVSSAVITLIPRERPLFPAKKETLERLLAKAFGQRRKMLRNSLAAFLGKGATPAPDFPIDLNRRPETLSLQEFTELAEYLAKAPLKN